MADNDALITQFMDVTGVQRDRAEFYLQAANFQIDIALSSFYEESADDPPALSVDDNDDNNVVVTGKGSSKRGNKNFATISSVREPEKEGDDKGQAFYAGGSEHSGLQVLGPPPKKNPIKDMVSEVFKQAQAGNMEQFDSSQEDSPSFRSFTGTGYRLGQTEDDSVAIATSSKGKKSEEHSTVTVKVYKQGFTVDDGDLRSYEDPRNREFFESITRNEIPQELRKPGKPMVHVNVENHLGEDFVKQAPKFKAFTGSGNVLGSPAPPTTSEISTTTSGSGDVKTTNAENEAKASSELNINESEPTTMISIRLNDGSRISARFNLTHTIQDIRQYVMTSRPEFSGRSFILLTTFPNKELTNPSDTIQLAGLQNAAILQRMK